MDADSRVSTDERMQRRDAMSDSRYLQLVVANVLVAVAMMTFVFGGPVAPVCIGALAAGGVLYLRRRR